MNVVDEAAVEKGRADVMAKYGRIDLLVSNAGIQIVQPVVDFPTPTGRSCCRSISTARS
jgi:3-hydroxybutyrate dehydrogenase